MNVKTFIDRPIFAGVISVMILLVGFIGLVQLPVEQFPEIAPPTVSVSANYAGANAETVQKQLSVFGSYGTALYITLIVGKQISVGTTKLKLLMTHSERIKRKTVTDEMHRLYRLIEALCRLCGNLCAYLRYFDKLSLPLPFRLIRKRKSQL